MAEELNEEPGPPLTPESLRRAVENIKDACRVPEVTPLRPEELGAYPEDQPRYGAVLHAMLARALADADLSPGPVELRVREQTDFDSQAPPTIEVVHRGRTAYSFEEPRDFLGIPIVTDASLPPGTWELRHDDGSKMTGRWPRVTVPGVETLDQALDRLGEDVRPPGPPPLYSQEQLTKALLYRDFEHYIALQTWFRDGLSLIDRLRTEHYSLPPMVWLLPPDILPPGAPDMTQLFNLPVRYADGIRPHLAFELKEITP